MEQQAGPIKHTTNEPRGSIGRAVVDKLNDAETNLFEIVGPGQSFDKIQAYSMVVIAQSLIAGVFALRDIAYAIRESK